MKKHVILLFLFVIALSIKAQNKEDVKHPQPNYRLASKFSPTNIAKMVHSTSVRPNWLKKSNRFWYEYKTSDGSNTYIVDVDKKTKKPLYDNAKMAKWLSEITKDPYDAKHLPRFNFEFTEDETAIRFTIKSNEMVDEKEKKEKDTKQDSTKVKKPKKPKKVKKEYYLEYKLGSDRLTILKDKEEDPKELDWANIAPDSSIVVYSKNFNLYWMDKENFKKALKDEKDSTIVEHQWTTEGVRNFGFGSGPSKEKDDKKEEIEKRRFVWGFWSHDSKKFVFQRTDSRMIKDLWVINSVDGKRPSLETYKYHMAGEQDFYEYEISIFDVSTKNRITVPLDTTKQQSVSIYRYRPKPSERKDFNPIRIISKQNKLYFSTVSRDRKRFDLHVADLNSGEYKTIIKEHLNTYVESQGLNLINNETEIIHWSERDGWAHYYLYDSNGNLKGQITNGEFHSGQIEHIDEDKRTLYFNAHGVDKSIDPYYQHLYKINFDGSGFKPLNPGNYNSSVSMPENGKSFVSNYSRVNTVPTSELRDNNGKLLLELEKADLSQLFAAGYKFPEPFKVKAADGITDIYGVMYKPFDFNPDLKYPIIEYVYPGPQTEAVNKSFSVSMNRTDRMAQVGFIVVTLGNRGGHPDRSKWYHNYGYGNLRDYGLDDKKYAAEQLANKYDFIDIEKVGIFGHSGGGFMSTAAMLVYPDFFKVAVSSAGNHDNTIYNSWWSETHHGIMEEENEKGEIIYKYQIDNNQSLAKNLKGHLYLVTGDVDNNVHPAATYRVADALIKANKRFDFKLMTGQRHGFGRMTEYFFWLKADYFSKHLLGVENNTVDIIEMNRDFPQNK